jgi:hypothetical protein
MFFKRPKKPVTPDVSASRRAFFRDLFVKAVQGVEQASHELADRMKPLTESPPLYTPANTASWQQPIREVYGPPWPPPYGPPVPTAILQMLRLNPPAKVDPQYPTD